MASTCQRQTQGHAGLLAPQVSTGLQAALYCRERTGQSSNPQSRGKGQESMDSTPSTPASSDLTQYGVLLRRRWWVVAAFAVIGLAVGGALLVTQAKVYTAAAQILIKDASSDPAQQTGKKSTVNLDTEA